MKPSIITFTGVDEETDIDEMELLSDQYPIEWGILFSPKRQGRENRYPVLGTIARIVRNASHLTFSAHLCGDDAREVIETGQSRHDDLLSYWFDRSQINTADPKVQPSLIAHWGTTLQIKPILQCRGAFPKSAPLDVLYDPSGGRGREPSDWPAAPSEYFGGYAGGINPDNAARIVQALPHGGNRYWIDMESGVRDASDRLCLRRVRAVCQAIYD